MTSVKINCPRCNGQGQTEGFACGPSNCSWRTFKCNLCEGSGQVAPIIIERIRVGEIMRQDRISRNHSGREEAKRINADVIALNYLETGRGELLGQFDSFRKNGWPLCPRCEEDELYSNAGMAYAGNGPRPTLAQDYFSGFGCYRCQWKTK